MPFDPDLLYQAGLEAYNKGQMMGAKEFFQQAAQMGHPSAVQALSKVNNELTINPYSPDPFFAPQKNSRINTLALALHKK